MIVIIHLQRGIPSKRKSSTCIDYVPALCTLISPQCYCQFVRLLSSYTPSVALAFIRLLSTLSLASCAIMAAAARIQPRGEDVRTRRDALQDTLGYLASAPLPC